MKFYVITLWCLLASGASADQNREAENLARHFNFAVPSPTAPIPANKRTFSQRFAVTDCTLQAHGTNYAPADAEITFVLATHDLGALEFEADQNGKRYSFSDYADEQARARLNFRMTPPDATSHTQTHPLDMNAPMQRPLPDAWELQGTFGLGTFIFEGQITEQEIIKLLSAFDAYQTTYCS